MPAETDAAEYPAGDRVPLTTVARQWTRIGLTGFGGPPAHIALLRELVVGRGQWMDARAFEDANAACGLLPGPASTQLAIFCAYRVAGPAGAIVGGLGFIVPAVVMVLALSVLFLSSSPPLWVRGAGAGAGAAVAAVAVHAARGLLRPSLQHVGASTARRARWMAYILAGAAAAALIGAYLVLALLACGAVELAVQRRPWRVWGGARLMAPIGALGRRTVSTSRRGSPAPAMAATGGIGALAWTAFKVGALSFGGGFVIIPLMQSDAVHTYHWLTNPQFLNAVALGQVTPGPVVATVAAVGYGAHGLGGGLLAAVVAFAPSFSFILLGGGRFERLRANTGPRAFLDGAGPAAIGAIIGAAITLAAALTEGWQFAILAAAAIALLVLGRGVVFTLLAAGAVGVIAALAGAALPP
jgi:chromate transporter